MNADNVSAVSVKLPTFWPANAAVWFVQAEAQFATRGITADETKYYHVVAALDQDTATRVLDLIQAPPASNKYQALKERLQQTFMLTEAQRAAALLNLPGLGDEKPSCLMDKMLALLGGHSPCFLFRELFLRQMPSDIRSHLIHSNITDSRELAKAADNLWLARGSDVNAVRKNRALSRGETRVRTIKESKQSAAPPDTDQLCFYHRRFGRLAKQCRQPCSYPTSENFGAGRQ